jgi:hypothetical protein
METDRTDNRPAYVRQLDSERRASQAEVRALRAGMLDLVAYLNSPKFHAPSDRMGYVNVNDVLLRMDEFSTAATVAADEAAQEVNR